MKNESLFLRDVAVAKRYGVSRPTIWRWVKDKRIPSPIKLGAGSVRWRLIDLEVWEQSQVQKCNEIALR
jgi:predicted DNA-binding transcriptional regulator AlpA